MSLYFCCQGKITVNAQKSGWIGAAWLGAAILVGALALLASERGERAAEISTDFVQQKTILSETYTIDRKYRSMMGPYSVQEIRLGDVDRPELLWIVGYEAVMVGPDGEEAMPQEFMCHSNLDIDVSAHDAVLDASPGFGSRLFTLSQGQFHVRFPDGFGIPILSSEPLELTTQVLNLNHDEIELGVRHKVTVEYLRDQDLDGAEMVALFPGSAYGLTLLEGEDGYFGIQRPDEEEHGPGCLTGENASPHDYEDGMGRTFTGHWVVEPGRQVNRTLVTRLMNLPYDTRIHYIAVHLHPFAESLELRDLTTGETLFTSQAENFEDRIGLRRVDAFSSVEGIPVYRDHEYEIVSVYDNTTEEPQDSMAVMYLYLHDLDFDAKRTRRTL